MYRFTKTVAAVCAAVTLTAADSANPSFFDRALGAWAGTGSAFGGESQVNLSWERILGGQFFRLTVAYDTKTRDGAVQKFSGHGYYRAAAEGAYAGQWFDSQGNQYPIAATLAGDTLTAVWGIPGRIEGQSVYTLSGGGFTVSDAIKQNDGSLRPFSRFELKRPEE